MDTRPTLSSEIKSAIEQSRQKIFNTAAIRFDLLFFPFLTDMGLSLGNILTGPNVPRERMTETLKLQLRDYFVALFDAEAEHYVKLKADHAELRSWLESLASRTVPQVEEVAADSRQDFHCHPADRIKAIKAAASDRIEYWIDRRKSMTLTRILTRTVTPDDPITPLTGGHRWMPQVDAKKNLQIQATADQQTIGERLDFACLEADISHEEQAVRIGVSRTTYFAVKAGRGGRKARKRVSLYLNRLSSTTSDTKPN